MPSRWIRLAAEALYTTFAWSYDAVAWLVSMGQWSAWMAVGLEALPPGRVIELGHGPGHLLARRLEQGRPTIGVDRSRQMGRRARRLLRGQGLPLNLVRGKAQRLPFSAACADGVLSTFPSEYILDAETLAEIARVLKPGGVFVVIPMAVISGRSTLDRAAKWFAHQTGEDRLPPPALAESFQPQAMSLVSEWVELPRSRVLRLIGHKRLEAPGGEVR